MTLLFDKFNGVDGTALAAHAPDIGGPWVDDTPGLQLNGNQCLQTANASQSHVEMAPRIVHVSAVALMAGVDPANFLSISIANDAGSDTAEIQVTGDGTLTIHEIIGGVLQCSFRSNPATSAVISLASPLAISLNYGPDLFQALINGYAYSFKRLRPRVLQWQRVRLVTGGLNALPGVRVASLAVN